MCRQQIPPLLLLLWRVKNVTTFFRLLPSIPTHPPSLPFHVTNLATEGTEWMFYLLVYNGLRLKKKLAKMDRRLLGWASKRASDGEMDGGDYEESGWI
jgi:hypothetical protein